MRILVNGDGHTAAAQAVVPYDCADQDAGLFYLGRAPHPVNAEASWPRVLARTLKAVVHNESEHTNHNHDIMRHTLTWLDQHSQRAGDTVILIQWAPWTDQDAMHTHDEIWRFHQELQRRGLVHVFMNGDSSFQHMPADQQQDWDRSYIEPYNPEMTYASWLYNNGHSTVSPESRYFDAKAHVLWARFVLQYGLKHQIWR